MKNARVVICLTLLSVLGLRAQEGEEKVIKTIDSFFEAFHQQDSVALRQWVSKDMVLQTIGKNAEGAALVKTENFDHFLKAIVSIPSTTKFEERILDYNIQIDGLMAHAWTRYEFWVNGGLSHCGVNSFQMFNDQGSWKIIYLIDTRRKEGCD